MPLFVQVLLIYFMFFFSFKERYLFLTQTKLKNKFLFFILQKTGLIYTGTKIQPVKTK